jgi:hypothetical protein
MKKATPALPESLKSLLSEESIQVVESALIEKIELAVEAALEQQDSLYAEKLKALMDAVDKNHTEKLKKLLEAVDKDRANKLNKVVAKYNKELNESANEFKKTLVESISNYLEEYIDEAIPAEAILEATKNKTASNVLYNLRKVLAVDSSFLNESIKPALQDGKNIINSLEKQVDELAKQNKVLKESLSKTKSQLLLESMTAELPDKKKDFIKRVLSDKSPKFIEENFSYTLRLFDKKEQENVNVLKEQAYAKRKVKADAPTQIVAEKAVNSNPYVEALSLMK